MAKWTIRHSCRHEKVHQLYGSRSERERREEWLETRPCTACWQAEKKAAFDKKNAEAAARNSDMPALTGSPKQVAWAESLRASTRKTVEMAYKRFIRNPEKPCASEAEEKARQILSALMDEILAHSEAKWWIETGRENDYHKCSPRGLIQKLTPEVKTRMEI